MTTTTSYPLPPSLLETPSAWLGKDMAATPDRWLVHLTEAQVAELETAATRFLDSGKAIGEMCGDDFVLPEFAGPLADLRRTLIAGIGFQLMRGLPIASYSREMIAVIFCGIGAHLGKARSQNAMGHLLGHVRDVGADLADRNVRIYQTAKRQTFHTDSCDVAGLMCVHQAMEGGDSQLVSTVTLYNELQRRRPDLVPLLFEPIPMDRRGEVPAGEKPYFEIPVFSWYEGYLSALYQRQYIDSAQLIPGAPTLSDKKIEALDLLDALTNDPTLNFSMRLEPGDMQFVHNHTVMHDRTAFRDWSAPKPKRHLLRLWLSIPGDRPLPEVYKQRYGSVTVGDRGGIITPHTKLTLPIDID
ncbi:MAG: TauD/TfdA family dioxygenase [Alphaproteobacteria bacterium]|nr:TauD/TfdA family dioxygenase [Alphaproteobacteria bacterium]